jgi:prephenate dehydrogenase
MDDGAIAIIGTGLMGASVGLAAKRAGFGRRVVGLDADPAHLRDALTVGAIDLAVDSVAELPGDVSLIVVGTPVHVVPAVVSQLRSFRGIVTDLGSTKRTIVETVERDSPNVAFVGSHPMAGSEKKGPRHARADLFDGRPCLITPTPSTDDRATNVASEFWTRLGGRVVRIAPAEHDTAMAAVSHLPHAIAACLAGCTDPTLLPISAGGWRDTTRVAAAGAGIWEPIFRANRPALLDSITIFETHLRQLRRLLEADDGPGIAAWLDEAKRVRDALGN